MQNLFIVLEKIAYILLLIAAGIAAKKLKILSDKGEHDLARLVNDFFWPALIVYSICSGLNESDIAKNIILPVLSAVTIVVGFALGLVVTRVRHYEGDKRKIFLFHASFNNYSFMVLPFATAFLPKTGAGLLFISNLGFVVLIWTLGVWILKGKLSPKELLLHLLSPGLVATVLSILLVLSGLNRHLPHLFLDVAQTLGAPTIPVAMILAGAQIQRLGVDALKFDGFNVTLGILRLLIIPALMFGLALVQKITTGMSDDLLLIFMLVSLMPVSINSVSMAIKYGSSPGLAAQGIVFTHLFSIVTIAGFMILVQAFLL